MASKTISLKIEAYERLRSARRYRSESFSEVVLRATWPEETITGGGLLKLVRERGPAFAAETLVELEKVKADDRPPSDKWSEP